MDPAQLGLSAITDSFTGLNADIVIGVPVEGFCSTITGFICDNGGPFDDKADVQINNADGTGNLNQTFGPVLITVDSPNSTMPCKQIDINP